MEGSENHYKNTKGRELFKGKLTRCKTAKSNLTKSLTAFQNSVKDFEETESPFQLFSFTAFQSYRDIEETEIPPVNYATKAKAVMEGAEKMETMLENLRLTMEDFMDYVAGLGEEAFEAPHTPTTVIMKANSDMDDREKAMRNKISEHEQVIRRAETILASEVVLAKQVVEKPENTAEFSAFRQQVDLTTSILEREVNFAKPRHFTESFTNYFGDRLPWRPWRPWETGGMGEAGGSGGLGNSKRRRERERKKEKEKLLKEAKAAQSSDMKPAPTNSKKCAFTFEEDRMLKLNGEMEKHLDLTQVLHAKSAKGKLSPILQGQCFKNRRDKFYTTENMLADTGCSYNVCGEQICRDLRIRIYPFKNNMQIMDASGNFLKLIGSAVLYVRTQVLGLNTIKKLEVAVQKQGVSEEREILLSLKTLMDWNIVHPGFPHIKLDDYVENLVNKQIHQNKACTAVY